MEWNRRNMGFSPKITMNFDTFFVFSKNDSINSFPLYGEGEYSNFPHI